MVRGCRRLEAGGLSYQDVVRTWIYVSSILDWYADFNSARRLVFCRAGLLDGSRSRWLPASTGIEGGALLAGGAKWAFWRSPA